MRIRFLVLMLVGLAGVDRCLGDAESVAMRERLVFCGANLVVEKTGDDLEALFRRAARAGYTGIVLSDGKFGRLDEMGPSYFRTVDRLRKVAAEERLEIIPLVFPLGWSEPLLARDPHLAEGLPVREALFEVRGGVARLVPDPPVGLPGGDMSDLSRWSWKDDTVVAENGKARVTDPNGRNARLVQKLTLRPFRQYHISVRIRTRDFRGEPQIQVLARRLIGKHRPLQFTRLGVKPTQDWTAHHVVFNSLTENTVSVYFGCWGATTGSLWWDDARIEEVGLVNLLRRDGAPLLVRREDGTPLVEGRDFDPLTDPRMGTVPWRGAYEVWHEPPVIRTKLPDGTRLRVSYYHPVIVGNDQVMICPSEPKTVELLRDQARRVHAAWQARAYFMGHDEIRVLNWDESCARRNLDAGAILADNIRTCIQILRETAPKARLYVWSDMFDPHHNARRDYYLVRGDLRGSWEGLDPQVIIAVWNHASRDASLRWFAGRGHPILIAGYYDDPSLNQLRDWLESAREVPAVVGAMYTTWKKNYDHLERFQEVLRRHR